MKRIITSLIALAAAATLTSCESGPNAQQGTLIGAGTGALAGGIIGHQSGNTAEGALIGAAAGGLIGNQVGANKDKQQYQQPRPLYYDAYGRPVYQRY